jgi:hypothetical protein
MEPASREEWFGLLSDYVRNALNERLQARESAQFNRHVLLLDEELWPWFCLLTSDVNSTPVCCTSSRISQRQISERKPRCAAAF